MLHLNQNRWSVPTGYDHFILHLFCYHIILFFERETCCVWCFWSWLNQFVHLRVRLETRTNMPVWLQIKPSLPYLRATCWPPPLLASILLRWMMYYVRRIPLRVVISVTSKCRRCNAFCEWRQFTAGSQSSVIVIAGREVTHRAWLVSPQL